MTSLALGFMLVGAACSGSSKPPPTDTTTESASTAAPAEWGRADPQEGSGKPDDSKSCFAKCGELIKTADSLFDRAHALDEGPARARANERAGEAYVDAWRGCSLGVGGEDNACEGAATLVSRMVASFGPTSGMDRTIFALLVARDRRWRTEADAPDDASLADAAAKAEKSTAEHPDAPASKDSIRAAAYARIALGQAPLATRDIADFRRIGGKSAQDDATMLTIALAAWYNDEGKHADALRVLGAAPASPPRLFVLWHAEQGRASQGLHRAQPAAQAFRRVLDTWQGLPQDDLRKHLGGAEPSPMLGRERVVDAVGAAHFFLADQLREKAAELTIPKYKGPNTVQGATEYINGSIGPYVRERQARLLEADAAFQRVSEVKPVPPTRWVIASASRMGQMWSAFADDIVKSAAPPHIAKDPELEAGYRKTLSESMKPIVDKARRAFLVCRDAAQRSRLDDAFTRACESWLRENPEP
jgi:hypothetical protein